MINLITTKLTGLLNEYLNAFYDLPEEMVEAGIPGASAEEAPNKILVTLFNIEQESTLRNGNAYHSLPSGDFSRSAPPWYMNLYFVVAAVFAAERYAEALKALSKAIAFLQSNTSLVLENGHTVSIEPVTFNIQELTNLWSILGGKYYPSMIIKVRMVTIDGNEIKHTAGKISHLKHT